MRCKRKKKTQSRKLLAVFVTILPDYQNPVCSRNRYIRCADSLGEAHHVMLHYMQYLLVILVCN